MQNDNFSIDNREKQVHFAMGFFFCYNTVVLKIKNENKENRYYQETGSKSPVKNRCGKYVKNVKRAVDLQYLINRN